MRSFLPRFLLLAHASSLGAVRTAVRLVTLSAVPLGAVEGGAAATADALPAPAASTMAVAPVAANARSASAGLPPAPGAVAPVFTLAGLDGKAMDFGRAVATGPTVLVFLRGWPGYQCPMCTRQVQDFVKHAADFAARGAQVVMVYPGPAADLTAHAREFLENKQWPATFRLVLDPDYAVTVRYGLRWDAPRETAYPSTFVLAQGGKILFAHVSHSHGDRVPAADALRALPERR